MPARQQLCEPPATREGNAIEAPAAMVLGELAGLGSVAPGGAGGGTTRPWPPVPVPQKWGGLGGRNNLATRDGRLGFFDALSFKVRTPYRKRSLLLLGLEPARPQIRPPRCRAQDTTRLRAR